MNIEKIAAKLFNMSDAVWKKHANPWSVWTRYSCLPLFLFAIWSRIWIGWCSLIPITVVAMWIWLNPRVFGIPKSTNNWASKAVLGERILLAHPTEEIPKHHRNAIKVLKLIMTIGFLLTTYGLVVLNGSLTSIGAILLILGKTWFLDRMVWLYQDLQSEREEYQKWLY